MNPCIRPLLLYSHLCLGGLGTGSGELLADLETGLFCILSVGSVRLRYAIVLSSTHLLSQAHNLEALEVGELLALDGALAVLGPGAVVPGAVNTNLLPESLKGSVTGGAGKLLNDDGSQREIREGGGVAGDGSLGVGRGTLDKDLFHTLSVLRSC